MALQKEYNDRFGNTHSQAYYRVTDILMGLSNSVATATVCVFKDVNARNGNKAPIEIITYKFNTNNYNQIFGVASMENKNPIKGIYDEIKTYPEFSGSIDV